MEVRPIFPPSLVHSRRGKVAGRRTTLLPFLVHSRGREDYSSPALIHSGGGGEVDGRRPIFPLPPLPPPVHSGGGGKVAGRRTTLPPILIHFGGREVAGMTTGVGSGWEEDFSSLSTLEGESWLEEATLAPTLVHSGGGKLVGGRLLFLPPSLS